jgi:hypothetical protein
MDRCAPGAARGLRDTSREKPHQGGRSVELQLPGIDGAGRAHLLGVAGSRSSRDAFTPRSKELKMMLQNKTAVIPQEKMS